LEFFNKNIPKSIRTYPFLLTFIWWILVLIINPVGDFPLNDDWSYAINAKELSENNKIYFHDWGAMTLFAHTVWGSLFCKLFGFSFTALRFSTLVLGWVGVLTTFHFFKGAKIEKQTAFWATLLVLFNPMFFCHAYSYMTEVPFYCFLILGAYFFQKNINEGGFQNIALATLFSIIAVLIRQHGVLMPLAFLFIFLIKNKLGLKTIIKSITPFIITYASMHFFIKWRKANFGLSDTFRTFDDMVRMIEDGRVMFTLKYDLHGIFNFWGLFLLPILILLIPFFWKKINRSTQLLSIATTLLLAFPYFKKWNHGFHGNVFYNLGLGPRGGLEYPLDHHPILPEPIWTGIILIAFIGGILLLKWLLIHSTQTLISFFQKKSKPIDWSRAFALTAAFGYFLFLLTSEWMFSRYYLMAIPFLIIVLLPKDGFSKIAKGWKIASAVAFFFIFIFSVGATKDYLSWNRARLAATQYLLEEKKIDVVDFNGGFEWSGWLNIPGQRNFAFESYEWWLSEKKGFRLSFGEICGYEKNADLAFPIQRVLPPGRDTIFVLEKKSSNQLDVIKCNLDSLSDDNQYFLSSFKNVMLGNADSQSDEKSHSGNFSAKLDAQNQYALTFQISNIEPCDKIWIDLWRNPAHSDASIVLAASDPKKFYESEGNNLMQIDKNDWGQLAQFYTIPRMKF